MSKPPTSYPYLTVAKAYGVDYWRVLKFADMLDEWPPNPGDWYLPKTWMVATVLAFRHEQERRKTLQPLTVRWSVVGDFTSWDPDPSTGHTRTDR